jgi:hypothetical protein
MISALQTALSAYTARGDEIARIGRKLANPAPDENLAGDLVAMMVQKHVAEANLVVARVAVVTDQSLLHVIA